MEISNTCTVPSPRNSSGDGEPSPPYLQVRLKPAAWYQPGSTPNGYGMLMLPQLLVQPPAVSSSSRQQTQLSPPHPILAVAAVACGNCHRHRRTVISGAILLRITTFTSVLATAALMFVELNLYST